jgi:hypothetical protein
VVAGLVPLGLLACTGTTIVRARPAHATVTIDGQRLNGNAFEYGRWIGNEYHLRVRADGHEPQERVLDVHVGKRAGLIAVYSPIVGLLAVPWNGEIAEEVYVDLQRTDRIQ